MAPCGFAPWRWKGGQVTAIFGSGASAPSSTSGIRDEGRDPFQLLHPGLVVEVGHVAGGEVGVLDAPERLVGQAEMGNHVLRRVVRRGEVVVAVLDAHP